MQSKQEKHSTRNWHIDLKPYRVLLIIGDQWRDPNSFVISCKWNIPFDYSSGKGDDCEFEQIAALLKSWCIPFDILRLDENDLKIEDFLNEEMKPKYGCILWDADQSKLGNRDYPVLEQAVADYGISLIAISNKIKEPVICKLLGLEYLATHSHSSRIEVSADHFITREMTGATIPKNKIFPYQKRVQVKLTDALALAVQGKFPQITVKNISKDTKAVWIGGDYSIMFDWYPEMRELLRLAITWCIGYSIYKTYPDTVIIVMDDPGSAQNAYLEHWHYPTLSKTQIMERLILPLKENGALLVINVCPGFPDVETKKIIPSWTKKMVDRFGALQDYPSTKEGIDEGLRLGVFEIQSHGWTHMHPDLRYPSCPWWEADVEGEKAEVGWYREFGDVRKRIDIPAEIQRVHMNRSVEGIRSQFGVTPLALRPGGAGISIAPENNTSMLAALEGFGWCGGSKGGYCGKDLVIENMMGMMGSKNSPRNGSDDAPRLINAPPDGHDREVSLYEKGFVWGLEKFKDFKFMGLNEYIGYMHAKMNVSGGSEFRIDFDYDDHYCQHFKDHPSTWILHLSDRVREKLTLFNEPDIIVDGKEIGSIREIQSNKQEEAIDPSIRARIKNLFTRVFPDRRVSRDEKDKASNPSYTSAYLNEVVNIKLPAGIGKHSIIFRPKK